uniref:Uncharacterized protein n=1 Tax=Megaselia scalaris TaxID=36166 RepID=T1GYM0_MEGSC
MEMAKNLFGSRDHEGYVGKEEHNKQQLNDSEEEPDYPDCITEEINVIDGLRPNPGGPFSALTPSMWPQEILAKLKEPSVDEPYYQPDYQFDEFGFRVEEEDGPEQMSKKIL